MNAADLKAREELVAQDRRWLQVADLFDKADELRKEAGRSRNRGGHMAIRRRAMRHRANEYMNQAIDLRMQITREAE